MNTTRLLHESGTLLESKKGSDTWRVRIITEGTGSSGYYSGELLENYGDVFNGRPSFMDHPLDVWAPQRRSSKDIAGRIVEGSVEIKTVDGIKVVEADYRPNSNWRTYLEENGDLLGLSIYVGSTGREDENGNWVIEAFAREDPYSSVDVVVAGGRGGRFEHAQESMRRIKESAGQPAPHTSVTSAADTTKEVHMDPEVKAAFESLNSRFDALVAAQKAAEDAATAAEASADAVASATKKAVQEAVEAHSANVVLINAAEGLLPSQVDALIAESATGADITASLEAATKLVTEFKTIAEGEVVSGGRTLSESATGDAKAVIPKGW
jgi:hypothetical protein